jgi:hypothetical protein
MLVLVTSNQVFSQLINTEEISIIELREHVKFLASDSLEGRKPGTKGGNLAAKYIRDQFKTYAKLFNDSSFHNFNITTGLELDSANELIFNHKEEAIINHDYIPLGYSGNGKLDAEIVFAGYGLIINKPNLFWNSYADIDVKGKWIMVIRGAPDNSVDYKKYLLFASDRKKVKTAIGRGAAGVILVSSQFINRDDDLMILRYDNRYESFSIPVLNVTRAFADKILAKKNGINKLENKIIRRKKSVAFKLTNTIKASVKIRHTKIQAKNVIAIIEGADSILKNEYIVVGGHYDHLGWGGYRSGSRKPDTVAVHNGADDNASGVATIIEIGEKLAVNKLALKHSIVLVAFDGEEMGLLGSKAFFKDSVLPYGSIKAMFNFDMVGRFNRISKKLMLKGIGTSPEFKQTLDSLEKDFDIDFKHFLRGLGPSDHANFYLNKIPVLMITTGIHKDYHMPEDDIEFINFSGQKLISDFSYNLILNVANREVPLSFQNTDKMQNKGELEVNLGIIPELNSSLVGGIRVEKLTPCGPAKKAGIIKGDIITKFNNIKIKNLADFVSSISKIKSGQEITIDIIRGKKKKIILIKLSHLY